MIHPDFPDAPPPEGMIYRRVRPVDYAMLLDKFKIDGVEVELIEFRPCGCPTQLTFRRTDGAEGHFVISSDNPILDDFVPLDDRRFEKYRLEMAPEPPPAPINEKPEQLTIAQRIGAFLKSAGW